MPKRNAKNKGNCLELRSIFQLFTLSSQGSQGTSIFLLELHSEPPQTCRLLFFGSVRMYHTCCTANERILICFSRYTIYLLISSKIQFRNICSIPGKHSVYRGLVLYKFTPNLQSNSTSPTQTQVSDMNSYRGLKSG